MTYAEAAAFISAYEAQLLAGAGVQTIQIGDRSITYASTEAAESAYNRVLRDMKAYSRRQSNLNPNVVRPRWR